MLGLLTHRRPSSDVGSAMAGMPGLTPGAVLGAFHRDGQGSASRVTTLTSHEYIEGKMEFLRGGE